MGTWGKGGSETIRVDKITACCFTKRRGLWQEAEEGTDGDQKPHNPPGPFLPSLPPLYLGHCYPARHVHPGISAGNGPCASFSRTPPLCFLIGQFLISVISFRPLRSPSSLKAWSSSTGAATRSFQSCHVWRPPTGKHSFFSRIDYIAHFNIVIVGMFYASSVENYAL